MAPTQVQPAKDAKEEENMKKLIIPCIAASITLLAVACGGGDGDEKTATTAPQPTTAPATIAPATTTKATPAGTSDTSQSTPEAIKLEAAKAAITVDGSDADWADIDGATIDLKQIDISKLDPAQVQDLEIDIGDLPATSATLKVATDDTNIYVLVEVEDAFDYNPDPLQHNFSPALGVMFRIDSDAPPTMGVEVDDLETSLGVVDIWHWELDCGPGQMTGGAGVVGGDDPTCNFDDEYAPNPEDREDDGKGDIANATGENSLAGVWNHTAADQGAGAAGTWIFEMSRPLQTGDSQDAQLVAGAIAYMALAYFDPSETSEGWTDAGHLQSADAGWIEVSLP